MAKLADQFGREVRARRKARSMTQAQLSAATNLSEEWIRRIERGAGAPSFDAIEALAAGLGLSVADLFAPMSARDERAIKVGGMLSKLTDAELAWIEDVIRAAVTYPRR